MSNLIKGKATICIVNYKTLHFTRLCLRSIRKFTKYPYEVIVVDNDSQDESLKYLKLAWKLLSAYRQSEPIHFPVVKAFQITEHSPLLSGPRPTPTLLPHRTSCFFLIERTSTAASSIPNRVSAAEVNITVVRSVSLTAF